MKCTEWFGSVTTCHFSGKNTYGVSQDLISLLPKFLLFSHTILSVPIGISVASFQFLFKHACVYAGHKPRLKYSTQSMVYL